MGLEYLARSDGVLRRGGGVNGGAGDAVFDHQIVFLQLKEVIMESLGINSRKTAGEKIERAQRMVTDNS